MPDDRNIPTTIVEIVDVDMAMFRLRLAGKSCRMIARELHVAEDKVRETVEKMLTPITPKMKATALELELERLDQYQASQHEDAIKGDRDAIACCLKIAELRADFLGTLSSLAYHQQSEREDNNRITLCTFRPCKLCPVHRHNFVVEV
jgi:hypothetical protein